MDVYKRLLILAKAQIPRFLLAAFCMAIVGGAIMPPLAGLLSTDGDMRMALLVPLVCFGYVVVYVLRGWRVQTAAQ